MPQETLYTAAATEPDQIARATAQTLSLETFYDGEVAAAVVAGSSITIKDEGGNDIVAAAAITSPQGVASYDLAAATVPATLSYSDDWMIFWTLVMPDGRTYVFKRSAALVHSRLYPPVAQSHMTERHTELVTFVRDYDKSLQPYITAGWREVTGRLEEKGRRPWLILNSSSLFLTHLKFSLGFAYRDMAQSLAGGRYAELEVKYLEEAEKAFERVSLKYDSDEDQIPDEERTPAGPPILLMRTADWQS